MPKDTVVEIRPSNGVTTMPDVVPFVVQQVLKVEHCNVPGYEAFWIKSRLNLTNKERDALAAANDEVIAYSKEWVALPHAEQKQQESPLHRQHALIAPFIVAWNAAGINEVTGEVELLPPPAEAGPDVFDAISSDMTDWVRQATLNSYLMGKALGHYPAWSQRMRDRTPDGSDDDLS